MSKGKRNSIILLFLSLGLFGWWLCSSPKEPSYQGKPIDVWLDEMAETDFYGEQEQQDRARRAIAAIGPSAAPYIVRRIRLSDSVAHAKYVELYPRLPAWLARFLRPPKPVFQGTQGEFALVSLGTLVEPHLIPLLKDSSAAVRANAVWALGQIQWVDHTDIRNAMPSLIEGLHDPDAEVRRSCAITLGNMGHDANPAIGALKLCLHDAIKGSDQIFSFSPRGAAAYALWQIDSDITNTLPVLLDELNRPPGKHGAAAMAMMKAISEMEPRAKDIAPGFAEKLAALQSAQPGDPAWTAACQGITNALTKAASQNAHPQLTE